eukprot:2463033-Pleurochrysis_carterae.AAC.2
MTAVHACERTRVNGNVRAKRILLVIACNHEYEMTWREITGTVFSAISGLCTRHRGSLTQGRR